MRQLATAAAIVLFTSSLVSAQAPAGPEFTVDTALPDSKEDPSVGADGSGNLVVVWDNPKIPSSIHCKRLDAQGHPRGADFVVALGGQGLYPYDPRVHVAADGAFTVVWWAYEDFEGVDVYARRYDGAGAPRGPAFRVNTNANGVQISPAIAGDGTGAFVVVWGSEGQDGDRGAVVGRRFDAGGQPLGLEFVVNAQTAGDQGSAAIAMDAAGGFVVAWRSQVGYANGTAALAGQRFAPDGARVGGEIRISAFTTSVVSAPAVASAPAGGFVVAWLDSTGEPAQAMVRRFDAGGQAVGHEFPIATVGHTFLIPGRPPAVAVDSDGRFVVTWAPTEVATPMIQARRFDAAGAPRGHRFQVNTATSGTLRDTPALAFGPTDELTVLWSSDQGGRNLVGQHFRPLTPRALAADPTFSSTSNGNGVLEAGETVALRPSWHNHSGGALGLTGALDGITGPPGAVYTITDGAGDYGQVADDVIKACAECYAVGVSMPATRPAMHWDARATEALNADADGHQEWLLHVGDSFGDVPRTSAFYRFVETVLHAGVTSGCATGLYCPAVAVTREQMAVMALVAREGAGYAPFRCGTIRPRLFADVPVNSPFCPWVEELALRGVTAGCGGGNFCPDAAISREQLTVFLLRLLDPTFVPPACATPVFSDVPASSPFCPWVEEMARRGVVNGCGGGRFCGSEPVTREQMAVFLTTTFGLTLYGP